VTAWQGARSRVASLVAVLAVGACLAREPTASQPDLGEATLAVRADVSGTPVATVVVQVSAPDIPVALVFNIAVAGGIATGSITLPAGSRRTILMQAFDAGGVETHAGSVTIDIQPSANPSVTIVLVPLAGDVPISVTLGSVSVTVTPALDTLLIGDTVTLTAALRDANGNPIPGQVGWGSLLPGVALVVSTGTQSVRVTAPAPRAGRGWSRPMGARPDRRRSWSGGGTSLPQDRAAVTARGGRGTCRRR